ncbi:uncharacterized protein BP01DRAFT_370908 [Aspergillus saccharolyticus JOP 1030-1]|uniref:Rhodopsin domain-containing protein n=1 Tax=Aspergillus saccharolyticus JOP 1030-1 TaxID=1450539 RepID=A0A318ZS81_9EURO|nr:hypothetical protein BP01DRAFT_370908 [Aspergillus saccharolyticus JOP 1030-1]PYH49464.1 hypothetical protein BP01DRAFT_370908 [Aspergillus saccharolyticus JOP 1030-1]
MTEHVADVPDRGPLFVRVTAALTAIACILVVHRVVWKVYRRTPISADDAIIQSSMVIQIVNTVIGDLACHYAFGRHRADVVRSGGNIVLALKYFSLFQILYKTVLCLNKLSFLTFYLRIFPTRPFRLVCWVTIGLVIASTFGFVLATIFQCIPKCVDNTSFRWSWAGYNTAMDIWVCLMPLPVLAQLHLDRIRKVGVMLASTTIHDPTWGSFDALLWSAIEASTGIICACLPFLKHSAQKLVPSWFVSLSNGSRKSHSRTTRTRTGRSYRMSWRRERHEPEADAGSIGSQGAIAKGQIILTTDIAMHSEPAER